MTAADLSKLPRPVLDAIMAGPAGIPPTGIAIPDTYDQTLVPYNSAVLGVACSISTIALCARLYTKIRLIKKWNVEDTLLLLAWGLIVAFSVAASIGVSYGLCRHMWNIQLRSFFKALYWINVTAILYCVIVALIKVAILFQYIRIFAPSWNGNKGFLWTCYSTMVVVVIYYTIITFMTIYMCIPREAYWDPYVKGSCFNWALLAQATCIFTVISDFALFIIPIFPVMKLQMATKKKVMICLLFALGFIDCFAAIMRTYYTWQLVESPDISWNVSIMAMWTWIEMSFGILVASLPVSPRFYKHFKQRSSMLISSSWRKDSGSKSTQLSGSTAKASSSSKTPSRNIKSIEDGEYYNLETPSRTTFPDKIYG